MPCHVCLTSSIVTQLMKLFISYIMYSYHLFLRVPVDLLLRRFVFILTDFLLETDCVWVPPVLYTGPVLKVLLDPSLGVLLITTGSLAIGELFGVLLGVLSLNGKKI